MREILYRALSMCRGEHWVYGQPRHYARNPHTEKWTIYDPATGIETDIEPETIEQYTGLEDKNGKKIFEGDYLKTRALTGEVYVHEVRWTNEFNIAGFRMVDSDEYWDDFDDYDGRIEVVGNIHDDDIEKIKEEVYNA